MATTADPTAEEVRTGARGRRARQPEQIPASGWKDVLVRTHRQARDHNLSILAAGVAFYSMLAIVPALIGLVSVYGLLADPADVREQLESATRALPGDAQELVIDQLTRVTERAPSGLSITIVVGLLAMFWSASSGTLALVKGINAAYDEDETRGFVKLRGLALGLTCAALAGAVVMLALVIAVPALLRRTGLGDAAQGVLNVVRWPVLAGAIIVMLAVLYRYAPDRDEARWRWVSWGAAAATVVWVLASIGFSLYVSLMGNYNETYGALGAVIVLLLWLYLSAFAVLFGAELNAEMERQTVRDTTKGHEQPLGSRRAHAADTVGASTN